MLRLMLCTLVACFAGVAFAADTYKLTGENTTIEFTGTKKSGKHDGGFKKCTGTVTNDGGWKIEVTIDTESLYSDDAKLTNHLKGGDFFGVKDNPTAKFETSKIEKGDKGYTVTGTLTLLGKSKEISFPAEITTGDTFTMKAEFSIDRTDYGMTYGAGQVDNEVKLKVNVKAGK
jgi:polyisoprenoid-binding protein YceI